MVIGVLRALGIVAKKVNRKHSEEDIGVPVRSISVLFVRGVAPEVTAGTVQETEGQRDSETGRGCQHLRPRRRFGLFGPDTMWRRLQS